MEWKEGKEEHQVRRKRRAQAWYGVMGERRSRQVEEVEAKDE